jgi:beta-galactosidase GanA
LLYLAVGECRCAEQSEAQSHSKLPKIRLAKDGRGFETERGNPFIPFGVNYYRPGTGWAPQVWKEYDATATREDFARMKALGVNCVRVFLTYGSFYREPGVLEPEGLAKFDEFLSIAEAAGIYVHPTGPDHWEGPPAYDPAIENEDLVKALAAFWKLFAARYVGRSVIFSYDLRNEPEVPWDSPQINKRWNAYLEKTYRTTSALKQVWGMDEEPRFGSVQAPPASDSQGSKALLDYQKLRESLADQWTEAQVQAIKSVDPAALVTVGLIQWSVPTLLPAGVRHYSGFNPQRQAKFLDFMEVHFYPLARGAYDYQRPADEVANMAYLESLVREVARPGNLSSWPSSAGTVAGSRVLIGASIPPQVRNSTPATVRTW